MGALEEGIESLVKEENSLPKSILLLSEERKNKYATLTANDITEIARSKNIVINTIKYNRSYYEQYLEPTLSKETYGISKVLSTSAGTSRKSNPEKVRESESVIIDILENTVQRASGNQYLVGVNALNDTKGGQENTITIKQVCLLYTSPSPRD